MSTGADLYIDGYPHGTPEGYADGCRGGSCPTGIEYGLSCKAAFTKSNGDYTYSRYLAANPAATVAELAEHLGLYTPPTTVHEAPRTAPEPEPEETVMPTIPAPEADAEVGAGTIEPAPDPAPVVEVVATAAVIRVWARDNGVECPAMGKVPRRVLDAYNAAPSHEHAAPEAVVYQADDKPERPEWSTVARDADVAAAEAATASLQAELTRTREELEAARAHATRLASEMMRHEDTVAEQSRLLETLHTRGEVQRDAVLRQTREINALRGANTILQRQRQAIDTTPPPPPNFDQVLVFALTKWAEVSTQLNDAYAAIAASQRAAAELATAPRSWWGRRG